MKLSSYRRIYEQDYEGKDQQLVTNLSIPINGAFDELYDALNNNLTFSENLSCTIATFTVTADSSGNPTGNTVFALKSYQTTVQGLMVINARGARDASVIPVSAVYISYKRNENSIIIQNITGLQPNIAYKITVMALN